MKKVVSCCIKFIFVVKDWIIVVSSEKGYRLLSMFVLRENIIHLTVPLTAKCSFRYCELHITVRPGPFTKKERKDNIMGLREDKSP